MLDILFRAKSLNAVSRRKLDASRKLLVTIPVSETMSHLTAMTPKENVFANTLSEFEVFGEERGRARLAEYYRSRVCNTVADIWELSASNLEAIPAMGVVMPWSREDPVKKLQRIAVNPESDRPLSREAYEFGLSTEFDYGWQFFGPASDSLVSEEFRRLISVRNSIMKEGYNPRRGGHMHGYVLEYGGDRKVVVVGGKHRYAALIALGYEEIPVIIKAKLSHLCVYREEAECWPQVVSGLYTLDSALKIFDRQFGLGK